MTHGLEGRCSNPTELRERLSDFLWSDVIDKAAKVLCNLNFEL